MPRVPVRLRRRLSALALAALAWGAQAQTEDLSPVHLDLVRPHIQAGRWVWMGDSFAVPTRRRVPFATLLTWPLERVGAVAVGPQSTLAMATPVDGTARWVRSEDGYVLGRGTSREEPMGVPVYRLLEADLPVGDTRFARLIVDREALADGNAGAAGRALSGDATVRPLLFEQDEADARGTVRLGESATPLGMPGFRLGRPLGLGFGSRLASDLRADLSAPGLAHLAGVVVAGQPGHTAQFLADVSWSTTGFATDDAPAPPDRVKQFRTEHLANYLQATTLDPAQPSVVAFYLAPEPRPAEGVAETVRVAVARVRDAFQKAGLPRPVVLLVHSHAVETESVARAETVAFGRGLREVARADPEVAFVSLYASTGGVVFDGRPEAVAWLQREGWAELSYGTHTDGRDGPLRLVADERGALLDDRRLHPTEAGAAFFSAVLYQTLTAESRARGGVAVRTVLVPNPAFRGARVTGAGSDLPIYDVLGRLVGRTGVDGTFSAPRAAGVYIVGRTPLIVQ